MSRESIVYATFDRFPSPKGAATHVGAFVAALQREFEHVDLVTVAGPVANVAGSPPLPPELVGITHVELPALGATLVERVLNFRTNLRAWWGDRRPQVAHVRSIFEGYPIARQKSAWCERFVLEVNGLPSIELKYHYPQVADDRELMTKLLAQEQACFDAADLIVTVSDVNALHLQSRGVPAGKIVVISNGADVDTFSYQPPRIWGDHELRLLYAGTLSSWQGVEVAIDALATYRREFPARLTIVGLGRAGQAKKLLEFADRLGAGDAVEILDAVSQSELARLHHAADVVLAPLMPNDRNLVQGCCPLKVLEAMASGTPLIASDMPVVAALARAGEEAILVRPGSAKAIKDGLLQLRNEPALVSRLSQQARQRVEQDFTWSVAQRRLIEAYWERLDFGGRRRAVVRG